MTDTTKAQILEVARKAIHTEMLSLKRMEDTLGDEFATAVEMILGSRGKCIVTGMGKSGLVGRKIAATLASTGTPSFFLHPGEAFHGDLGMISKEDIVVALSYSGETDEILKIVPFIHSNGNKLVSMTGNPDSALAKNSDVHLDVGVKEEACILHLAPTSSTTAQIAMGDALAVSLMQMRGFTSVDFARLHPGGSLGRRLLMTVGNVMRDHDLPVVAPDCPAAEMIHAISKGGLGLIVICEGERIEGIVTDGDVRRAMERLRGEFFNIRASDIATRNPKTISPDEKLIEAEKMMTRNKVTSLLVTDAAGKLTGVIQIYDTKLYQCCRFRTVSVKRGEVFKKPPLVYLFPYVVRHFVRQLHRDFHQPADFAALPPRRLVDHLAHALLFDGVGVRASRCEHAADRFARPFVVAVEQFPADQVAVLGEGRTRLFVHVEDHAFGVAHRDGAVGLFGPGKGIFRCHCCIFTSCSRYAFRMRDLEMNPR